MVPVAEQLNQVMDLSFSCNRDIVSGKILIAPATCTAFSLQFSLAHDQAIFRNKWFTHAFLDHHLLITDLVTVLSV